MLDVKDNYKNILLKFINNNIKRSKNEHFINWHSRLWEGNSS